MCPCLSYAGFTPTPYVSISCSKITCKVYGRVHQRSVKGFAGLCVCWLRQLHLRYIWQLSNAATQKFSYSSLTLDWPNAVNAVQQPIRASHCSYVTIHVSWMKRGPSENIFNKRRFKKSEITLTEVRWTGTPKEEQKTCSLCPGRRFKLRGGRKIKRGTDGSSTESEPHPYAAPGANG